MALTVVAMFNLALAYHHRAIVDPDSSGSKRQQAVRIYCHCIELLVETNQSSFGVSLHAAATNNLAHLLFNDFADGAAAAELLRGLNENLQVLMLGVHEFFCESLGQILINIAMADSLDQVPAAAA